MHAGFTPQYLPTPRCVSRIRAPIYSYAVAQSRLTTRNCSPLQCPPEGVMVTLGTCYHWIAFSKGRVSLSPYVQYTIYVVARTSILAVLSVFGQAVVSEGGVGGAREVDQAVVSEVVSEVVSPVVSGVSMLASVNESVVVVLVKDCVKRGRLRGEVSER